MSQELTKADGLEQPFDAKSFKKGANKPKAVSSRSWIDDAEELGLDVEVVQEYAAGLGVTELSVIEKIRRAARLEVLSTKLGVGIEGTSLEDHGFADIYQYETDAETLLFRCTCGREVAMTTAQLKITNTASAKLSTLFKKNFDLTKRGSGDSVGWEEILDEIYEIARIESTEEVVRRRRDSDMASDNEVDDATDYLSSFISEATAIPTSVDPVNLNLRVEDGIVDFMARQGKIQKDIPVVVNTKGEVMVSPLVFGQWLSWVVKGGDKVDDAEAKRLLRLAGCRNKRVTFNHKVEAGDSTVWKDSKRTLAVVKKAIVEDSDLVFDVKVLYSDKYQPPSPSTSSGRGINI